MISMDLRIRLCLLSLFTAATVLAQGFSFGLKGGVPLTDGLKVLDRSRYFSDKAPYVIGPAVELGLFAGLSAEANLLYRRVQYSETQVTPQVARRSTGQAWEVPLLAKYRVPGALFRPFVTAGLSYRRLSGLEVEKPSTGGATVGGGAEASLPLVRISAEIRYTRWGSSSFRSAVSGLASQLNQADLLLGILF